MKGNGLMTAPTNEKRNFIKELTELGKAKGSISNKDILDVIGESDFEPEQLEKLYDALESAGVEIVEEDIIDDLSLESLNIDGVESDDLGTTTYEGMEPSETISIDDPVKV